MELTDDRVRALMTDHVSPLPERLDRQIRVFISSTFRDMMRERDLLVKEVFPALRRRCAERFVTFTEVDLRWGITEAQANEVQVLPLCLAEIERSRPYFLGLLGERYGWIPETIRPGLLERQLWLGEHVQGRTSVTELEILHGVLNDPAMEGLAFFPEEYTQCIYMEEPCRREFGNGATAWACGFRGRSRRRSGSEPAPKSTSHCKMATSSSGQRGGARTG